MCFWKRKKKKVITGNKFNVDQKVSFRRREDFMFGYIYDIHQDDNGVITYDIQVGGECPTIIENIPEDKIHARK